MEFTVVPDTETNREKYNVIGYSGSGIIISAKEKRDKIQKQIMEIIERARDATLKDSSWDGPVDKRLI